MRPIAEKIVDALLEGWFSDRWEDFKDFTGIGRDMMGLGKPEKGFKPKYGPVGAYKYKPVRKRRDPNQVIDLDQPRS